MADKDDKDGKVTLYDADGRSVTTSVRAEQVRLRAAGYSTTPPAEPAPADDGKDGDDGKAAGKAKATTPPNKAQPDGQSA